MSDAALKEVFSLFRRYELASGAKLNVTKSHGLLVGSWQSRSHLPISLTWSSQRITAMGAKLSNLAPEESWDSSLQQLEAVLSTWQACKLSYHGRALVVNSFVLSQLWYLASFLVMPADLLVGINSQIFSFLWQGKHERLPHSSIMQRISHGGLNVVDLDRKLGALHVMWVRRLMEGGDLPSTFFFRHYLRAAFAGRSLDQILLLPAPSQTTFNALPPFCRSVMVAWFKLPHMDAGTIFVGSQGSSQSLAMLTVAFVYRLLSTLAHTEHRCVPQYCSWGLAVEWCTAWSNLSLWHFIQPVRDTNWLIAFSVLACPLIQRLIVGPSSPLFIFLHSALWPAAFSVVLGSSQSLTVRSLCLFIPLPPSYWFATTVPAHSHLCFFASWASSVIGCRLPGMRIGLMAPR